MKQQQINQQKIKQLQQMQQHMQPHLTHIFGCSFVNISTWFASFSKILFDNATVYYCYGYQTIYLISL